MGIIKNILLVALLSSCSHLPKENRLAHASSPYLREHADNPVDWYEWGDEAIQKAKEQNKPLLLSIGYSSCHWCHVMEKESFMDTAIARLMNENFINIKIDREERPDIDNIYMNACQLLTGGGGWPLNAFALPDGKPFFAGSYYTKQSWGTLLQQVAQSWKEKKDLVVKQADALTKGIADDELSLQSASNETTIVTKAMYQQLFDSLYQQIDPRNGGLRGAPKFPMPAIGEFLLQYYYFTGNKDALNAATTALKRMALGGIYDQAGGGFARYTTDTAWHVPHFEKMLYDNGQLISLYAHAYQITRNDLFKDVLSETIAFVNRELSSAEGGFYSSINADTEEGEGEFYTWTFDEFKKIAGDTKGNLLAEYYNVLPDGNWARKKNILYASVTAPEFANEKKQTPADFAVLLNTTRKALLTERNKRNKPSADTKILASWNAIMLKGLIDAYTATGEPSFLSGALSNAAFIEKNMLQSNGRLWRNYKDGKATINAFLDDYAWVARAYIRLYQVTFDLHWLSLAKQLADYTVTNFYDNRSGLFYYTTAVDSLKTIVRKMEIADNVIPSSNAMMAGVLYELGIYFENPGFIEKSELMFSKVIKRINNLTSFHAQWCGMAGLFSYGTYEVAIMGKDAVAKNVQLQRQYLPNSLYMGSIDKENLPLLEAKLVEGKTMIYVCSNKVCKMPVEEVSRALDQISSKK